MLMYLYTLTVFFEKFYNNNAFILLGIADIKHSKTLQMCIYHKYQAENSISMIEIIQIISTVFLYRGSFKIVK